MYTFLLIMNSADDILNVLNDSDSSVVFYTQKHEELFMNNTDKLPIVKQYIGFDRTVDSGKFLSFNKQLNTGRNAMLKSTDYWLVILINSNYLFIHRVQRAVQKV